MIAVVAILRAKLDKNDELERPFTELPNGLGRTKVQHRLSTVPLPDRTQHLQNSRALWR